MFTCYISVSLSMVGSHSVPMSSFKHFSYNICFLMLPVSSCSRYVFLKWPFLSTSFFFQAWICNHLNYNKCQIGSEWNVVTSGSEPSSSESLFSSHHIITEISRKLLYLANEIQAYSTEGYFSVGGVEKLYFLTSYPTVLRPVVFSGVRWWHPLCCKSIITLAL